MKWVTSCAFVCAALALAVCDRSAGAVTVRLGATDTSSVLAVHMGDRVRMELPTAPSAGFRWSMKKLDASHLETMAAEVRPDHAGRGAKGTQVFVWKAISPGHAEIRLEYSRPNDEKTIAPAKELLITVDVLAGELSAAPEDLSEVAWYTGTLPCADCTGISAELTLYAKSAKDFAQAVFVQRWQYVGGIGGDRTRIDTGRLAVVHGTYANAAATVYVLDGAAGGNYRMEGEKLVVLDGQMLTEPGVGGAEIVLKKIPEAASTP